MAYKSRPKLFWLKCKVSRGMFTEEVTIVVDLPEGKAVSFFFPRHKVRLDAHEEGRIPVALLKSEGRVKVVALPQATLEGPSIVRVSEEALVGA